MYSRFVFMCFVQIYLIELCCSNSKDLHLNKVSTHSNNNEMKIDKDNKYDEMISKNERFARHAEAITENVAEHILKEINRKYPKTDKRKRKLLSALKKKYGRQKEKTQKRKMTKNENRKKMTTRNSN
ncbi:uncharacterized protein LOC114252959 [Bombyx mandarina]|uniref:Uncharacterized protein n=2 Tax=Bombyx TaxID=7090 RepID=A0A8R1WMG9_BOMMO|nr:uncharacterized protein LOC101739122 isoform X2 [Bombyx mori]XP_028043462.1 uncharacterized protein LOC114252959 [Bombyx mandarina]